MKFKAREHIFDLDQDPVIMGILNITPDSFSDGGNFINEDQALFHCERMIQDGVDIIDIGGESSRPGSVGVSAEEELNRIGSIVAKVRKEFNICISVDTYKPQVAEEVLKLGADMINDITLLITILLPLYPNLTGDFLQESLADKTFNFSQIMCRPAPEFLKSPRL